MPANVQELRRRIKATSSIKQITKAMEMIAASKMRRASAAALMSRPYADLAWEIASSIIESRNIKDQSSKSKENGEAPLHPLLRRVEEPQVVLTILVAPNRGLCGSLPTQIIAEGLKNDVLGQKYVTVGRKANRAILRAEAPILAHFEGFEGQPSPKDTRPVAQLAIKAFIGEEVDAVDVVYADFVSTLVYKVKRSRLLPIGVRDPGLGSIANSPSTSLRTSKLQMANSSKNDSSHLPFAISHSPTEFLFEPSPKTVLDEMLPRLVELQIYQVIVDALASEHSSRMVTMQNASKAADDLIDDFTLTYNGARQAAITSELADIIGGRLAVAR